MSKLSSIYVALDNLSKEEIYNLLDSSNGEIKSIKIGLELFNKYGQDIVTDLYDKYGLDIFLDLKLHDIPSTVSKAIRSLKGLPIKFLTIHLSGGLEMIEHAISSRDSHLPQCKILGVSILTSLDQKNIEDIWGIIDTKNLFSSLFLLGKRGGIDGVVCSPAELEILNSLELNLLSMCPGIRFRDEIENGSTGDQKRVITPKEAMTLGADCLVIGRSLTKSKNLAERIELLKKI